MNSFQFRFRPSLESMDERIVPDATPIAAPVPAAAANTAIAAPPVGDLTDDQLNGRIAQLTSELTSLNGQLAAAQFLLAQSTQDRINLEGAYNAIDGNADPAGKALAKARWEQAKATEEREKAFVDSIKSQIKDVQAELDALRAERARRDALKPITPDQVPSNTATAV